MNFLRRVVATSSRLTGTAGSTACELKMRGVNDILIAVVDGLKGFPEATTSVYPQTVVQICIVHLIRNSLRRLRP